MILQSEHWDCDRCKPRRPACFLVFYRYLFHSIKNKIISVPCITAMRAILETHIAFRRHLADRFRHQICKIIQPASDEFHKLLALPNVSVAYFLNQLFTGKTTVIPFIEFFHVGIAKASLVQRRMVGCTQIVVNPYTVRPDFRVFFQLRNNIVV